MAMDENDVATMADEVLGEIVVDPDVEAEWAAVTIRSLRSQEQRLAAEWKMWRFLRDDSRMQAIVEELRRTRGCISYLSKVLSDQSGKES